MKTVWKFPLLQRGDQVVKMPEGAEILTVQYQNGWPHLWAIVDTEKPDTERAVEIFGTGHEMPIDIGVSRTYIETIQAGGLVWHVFERLT